MRPPRLVSIGILVGFCSIAPAITAEAGNQVAASASTDPRLYFDRMARFLAGAPQFQTTAHMGYDVVQESGQKIEFSERHRITLARPDRLRVDIRKSNGDKGAVIFDGNKITSFSSTHKVYAEAQKQGDLDALMEYFLRDLRMRLPLALMFRSDFPEEMAKRLVNLEFVEISAIADTPCVHLAGRTDQVDFQVWIPRSGEPLPRRLTIDYRDEPGQPKFWADFKDWNLTPAIAAADFRFAPPAGTERIPFLVEIDRAPSGKNGQGDN